MRLRYGFLFLFVTLALAACGGQQKREAGPAVQAPKTLRVTSSVLADGGAVPKKFTCNGDDVSPPLTIANVPSSTVEIALIVDDPDASGGTFTHWVAWGIDPANPELAESQAPPHQGRNDYGRTGYRGPCPPQGKPHHYVFTAFALSTKLDLSDSTKAGDLRRAIESKVLAQGALTATYERR